jgi:hypothetical protein
MLGKIIFVDFILYSLIFQINILGYPLQFSSSFRALEEFQSKTIRFEKKSLPTFAETDEIELYHLRAFPRLSVSSQAGLFSVQTSGIALRSTSTSETVVLVYEPANYSACFLPIIAPNNSLSWDMRSKITYLEDLDISLWQQSTFLGLLNGVVYANYVQWIESYMRKYPIFMPHSFCSGSDRLSCFTPSQTWDNFVADRLSLYN